MIDAGLTIYDNTFNEDMQDTFVIVICHGNGSIQSIWW